jgi:hypothetical protein
MLDALVDTAGPFLIPIAIFVAGIAGYLLLLVLSRQGLLNGD